MPRDKGKRTLDAVTVYAMKGKLARLRHLDPKARKRMRRANACGYNPRKLAQQLVMGTRTKVM